jgi:hypothetical protein
MRQFQTANTARIPRRAPGRPRLQLEALEERVVLSAASLTGALDGSLIASTQPITPPPPVAKATLNGSTLDVVVNQENETITFLGGDLPNKLNVYLNNSKLLGQFPASAVQNVDVSLTSLDSVVINDGHGFPFAPGTTISLSGSGSENPVTLTGSVAVNGRETYTGGNGFQGASLTVDGTTLNFDNGIGTVTDSLKATGLFQVNAYGNFPTLFGNGGGVQTLTGLSSNGAGDTLTFSNKSGVSLVMLSNNSTGTLDATAAAAGEQTFNVSLAGNNQGLYINATPTNLPTTVNVFGGQYDAVNLFANSSPVTIAGNSSTHVILGRGSGNTEVMSGIKASVKVEDVATLILADFDNTTTQEKVTVTDKAIFGTGMFGNPLAQVNYSNVGHLYIDTGYLASGLQESFTIEGSSPTATFPTPIEIDDDAAVGLSVTVDLTPSSDLNLNVDNAATPAAGPAYLYVNAIGGTFTQTPDSDTVTFGAPNTTSTIDYEAYNGNVTVYNFNGVHNLP